MPGTGTRRQKAASPADREARSWSRWPRRKEGRRTQAGRGRGFKTRLTGEKLLKERAVLQDLPETSVGPDAGPAAARRVPLSTAQWWAPSGSTPPPLPSPDFPSARLKPRPASSLGRGEAGARWNLQSERGLGVRLPASRTVSDKTSGACDVSDLTSGAQLYGGCSVFPPCALGLRHVSGFTSRVLAFCQVQSLSVTFPGFTSRVRLHVTCPGFPRCQGFPSGALPFRTFPHFLQVPCLSVTFPGFTSRVWLHVACPGFLRCQGFPSGALPFRHVPSFMSRALAFRHVPGCMSCALLLQQCLALR